jgi:hypothetical protein
MSSKDKSNTDSTQSCHSDALSKMKLIIHNQFPGIELVSSVYYSDVTTCCLSPIYRVATGSTIQTDFDIDPDQEESISILMYKLQRDNFYQFNENGISSEEEEEEEEEEE